MYFLSFFLCKSYFFFFFRKLFIFFWGIGASLVAQTVKNLPSMQETWVRSLGWEDSLEEGMGTHFTVLAWRIPVDREA